MYRLNENIISIINLADLSMAEKIQLPGHSRTMAFHPRGEYLVAECQGMIALVHLPTKTTLKTFWIPLPPGPERDLMEAFSASEKCEQIIDKFISITGQYQTDEDRQKLLRHYLPKQSVFSIGFGEAGNFLFCGTNSGVSVVAWDKILAAKDGDSMNPQAFVPGEAPISEDGRIERSLVYSVVADSLQRRVLFSGLEGKVRFVNFSGGAVGDLINPPFRHPIWKLELTPDRTSLIATAIPRSHGRSNKREPDSFQIWNYPALCQQADISF